MKANYLLVLVSNIETDPVVKIISDPYSKLNAYKQIYTTIAIEWHVNSDCLTTVK